MAAKKNFVNVASAPYGTIALATSGGHWYRNEYGWKWNGPGGVSGPTSQRPGNDWNGRLILPAA